MKFNIHLPDIDAYRTGFVNCDVTVPLKQVPWTRAGLLKSLPVPPAGKSGWPWTEETNPVNYRTEIQWPKVTIVTPSYNQAAFLEETIRSVLLQNYPNLEYVIIDGGSTDKSQEILAKYRPWISFYISEKDEGQGQAINKGFSLATGSYYSWINSDDYYLKGVFHTVTQEFMRGRKEFIYGYGYSYHSENNYFELVKVLPFLDYFRRIPSLVQPSCFWSAAIHQPVWEELECAMDYELWLRLAPGRRKKLLKFPLSVANIHDAAKTSDPEMKSAWDRDHLLICDDNAHGSVMDWNRRILLRRIFAYFYQRWDRVFIKQTRFKKANHV